MSPFCARLIPIHSAQPAAAAPRRRPGAPRCARPSSSKYSSWRPIMYAAVARSSRSRPPAAPAGRPPTAPHGRRSMPAGRTARGPVRPRRWRALSGAIIVPLGARPARSRVWSGHGALGPPSARASSRTTRRSCSPRAARAARSRSTCPAGESLQDHEVHERAYLTVVDGEVEVDAGETVSAGAGLAVRVRAQGAPRGPRDLRRPPAARARPVARRRAPGQPRLTVRPPAAALAPG